MQNRISEFSGRGLILFLAAGYICVYAQAPAAQPQLTDAQKEEFLLKAKVVETRNAKKGVTNTLRATLSDGTLTHDASIQKIDQSSQSFQTAMGTELMFRDSWKYNIAAYKLDRYLGNNMVPVTVQRKYAGSDASFTWWVDDFLMEEDQRQAKKVTPPDQDYWNKQTNIMHVFDQLIGNLDRNQGNMVFDKNWRLWLIDHSRSFRLGSDLRAPKDLVMCDADLLQKLKQIDEPTLKKLFGPLVEGMRVKGMVERRAKIVALFEKKGPSALFKFERKP